MAQKEKMRDVFSSPPDPEYWSEKTRSGWKLTAAEWEREGTAAIGDEVWVEEVPYGLRVAEDCGHLVENPNEKEALLLMLEMIVADRPFSEIARAVNEHGFRTRSGAMWTQVSVFEMLPRLVEVAPRIYPTLAWSERRKKIYRHSAVP
jgi:hypothetical protein